MDRIQLRRDTSQRWRDINPILLEGEVGIETDTKLRKVGDGANNWNNLDYLAAENVVQDLGSSETAVISQKIVTDNIDHLRKSFLPDRSFSGVPSIHANHLCNLNASGAFIGYIPNADFDTVWVQIFDTGTLNITGVTISYVHFFRSLNPVTFDYISHSESSTPTIPEGAKMALLTLPKATNPGGYSNIRVTHNGSGATRLDVQLSTRERLAFDSIIASFSGYGIVDYGHMINISATNVVTYVENANYDCTRVVVFPSSERLVVNGNTPSRFIFFSSYDFSNSTYITNNVTGVIPQGALFCIINFPKASNPNYNNLRVVQEDMGADKKSVDAIIQDTMYILPRGKNFLNPVENLIGFGVSVSAQGVLSIVSNSNGILSNRLRLSKDTFTISPDIIPNPVSNYVYLAHLNENDEVISYQRFDRSAGHSLTVSLPFGYSYSLLSLKNTATAVYNANTAQLEKGTVSTQFEPFVGKFSIRNISEQKDGYRPNMMLFGNSTAFPDNTWFLDACDMLGVMGYNRAVSGQLIYQFANNYKNRSQANPFGTLFTKEEFNNFEVLVLCHSNTVPIHLEDNLRETVEDYADFTFVPSTDYSMAWDYVLKQYRKDCYDAKFDPESKWYNTQEGKPCYIIVCTWPTDSRTTYNKSIRILQKKWGFALMNFDESALFASHVPMQDLIEPTNGPASYMTPVLYSHFAVNPSEGQNNVVNMWHQSRAANSPIQRKMALQFYSFVLSGLRSIYPEPDTQKITGQFYTIQGSAIQSSNGVAVIDGSGWWCTEFIPLDKSQDLIIDGYQNSQGTRTACAFYDANKNYIGCIQNAGVGESWNSSSNNWLTNYVIKKERFNSGGEFGNAFYFRCTDFSRRGEIKNMSIQYLLDKLIKLSNATGINFTTL